MLLAQKHLCQRTALFGKGTYFSDDLSVCLSFSPQSAKAPFSRLGENVSCICVCEVAQHPHIKKPGDVCDNTSQGAQVVPKHCALVNLCACL
eukprot:m.110035 g.110035  ORF g.110035 m.110035 type:complete len:92 (+) comp12741_c4_seq2:49-324(+)